MPACGELLRYARDRGARVALATRGDNGALLDDGHRLWEQRVIAVDVVDTLSAGDSFVGRFLVGYLRAESTGTTLAAAAIAATRTCQSYGAFGRGETYKLELAGDR